VLGLADAQSEEHGEESRNLVITLVACPVRGRREGAPRLSGRGRLRIDPGSRLAAIYPAGEVEEEFTCNYELNPRCEEALIRGGMRFTAFSDRGEARAAERPDHPFFVATLFQPQLASRPGRPHPIFVELLRAATTGSRPGSTPG
jgi:CTP synthase (UTP-ammonia lyase)